MTIPAGSAAKPIDLTVSSGNGDIDFTAARYDAAGKRTSNARITVKHNGVIIHRDLDLQGATPGRLSEGPTTESLLLQNHGDPVVFRNIWVIAKKAADGEHHS